MDESIDDPEKPDDSRIALLAKVWDDVEAEMIRQILLDYGIPVSVQSDLFHTLFPLRVDGLGEIRLYVPDDRLAEARELLAEHRRQGLEIVGENVTEDPSDQDVSTAPETSTGAGSDEDPPVGRRGEGEGR